jgi:hypothetical protein
LKSWIRIRIRVKSWILIRNRKKSWIRNNKVKSSGAFEAQNGAVEGRECPQRRRGGSKYSLYSYTAELMMVLTPVVADSHHFDEQDLDPRLK